MLSEIPVLRRRSGGGAVVHDLQTANFSLQTSKQQFDRTSLLNFLVTATKAHQPLQINKRYDLTLFGDKVSGSAYKIEKERAYHHATLLLNSDLAQLSRALNPSNNQPTVLESLGTDSVKSKVRNVGISKQQILEALETQFKTSFELINEADSDVLKEAEELKSWEWRFGKTPKFTALLNNDRYLVKNGRIAEGPKFIGQKFPSSTL